MFRVASWFLGIFTTLANFFMRFVSRRFAIASALVTALVGMTVAFSLAIKGLIAGLAVTLNAPPEFFMGIAAICPDNFEACIAAMISAKTLAWAYNFNRDILRMYLGGF